MGRSAGDQNGIFPNHLDILPWNDRILFPAKQSEQTISAADDNGRQCSILGIQLHIPDKAKSDSIAGADNILIFKIVDAAYHTRSPAFFSDTLYAGQQLDRTALLCVYVNKLGLELGVNDLLSAV